MYYKDHEPPISYFYSLGNHLNQLMNGTKIHKYQIKEKTVYLLIDLTYTEVKLCLEFSIGRLQCTSSYRDGPWVLGS